MNLSQLEVLVAIVESGSLTGAADVVGLTQSAVSHSLNRLEAELGVTLLERGRQGVTLTHTGEDVLQHARSILNQVEIIRQKTARARGLSVGKLRFGCIPNIPARILTGILRDFQHRYPDIEVVLFEGNARELITWLTDGIIDVGTVASPDVCEVMVPLAQSDIRVLLPVDHPLTIREVVSLEALADEPLIGPRTEYNTFAALPALRQTPLPELRYDVSAHNTIFAMVREKMGVSMMPQMLIDEASLEGIVSLPLTPPLTLQVYLAARVRSPAIEAFLNTAQIRAREQGFLNHQS